MKAFCVGVVFGCLLLIPGRLECAWAANQEKKTGEAGSSGTVSSEPSAEPRELIVDGRPAGQRVEAREGELCLVCGEPITQDDVAYLVDGQRVAAHRGECLGVLSAFPARWLARLKPRGAFLDASSASLGLSTGWLLVGIYVLLGLVFGALAAHRAVHVGRNPLAWLGVGLVANLPGYAVLLTLPKREVHAPAGVPTGLAKIAVTYSPEACPACGTENHPSASKCSGCGGTLNPQIVSEVQRVGLRSS